MKTKKEIIDLATQNGYAEYTENFNLSEREIKVEEDNEIRVETLWLGEGLAMKEYRVYSFKKNLQEIKNFFGGEFTKEGFLEIPENPELDRACMLNFFWALQKKNIFQVKISPMGNVYLRSIFPEAEGKFFQTPTRVSVPGLTYLDHEKMVSAKRDTILIIDTPTGFNRWEKPKFKNGDIVSIKGNYLDRIKSVPELGISVYPHADFGFVDNNKLLSLFERLSVSYSSPSTVQGIDEIFQFFKDKEYKEFEEEYREEFQKASVVGISGFYLNRYPIDPNLFFKVGMEIIGEGKKKKHFHVLVKKPSNGIILCPKKYMGMVIGKGGATIKKLREKWGMKIKINELA